MSVASPPRTPLPGAPPARDTIPRATYRLQLHRDFPLAAAQALVPYLARLGVSHVYSSPILRARRGSMHGYDVVDPTELNPELGEPAALAALATTLHRAGMGLLLDIVPNHMGTGDENPAWDDVLTHGPASAHARWFDIEWDEGGSGARRQVVLPVLGRPLDAVLATGEVAVAWTERGPRLRYFEQSFPLDPATLAPLVARAARAVAEAAEAAALNDVARALAALPARLAGGETAACVPRPGASAAAGTEAAVVPPSATGGARAAAAAPLLARLRALRARSDATRAALDAACAAPGVARGGTRLRALVLAQAYRLVHWRRAARVLNYRRFFDVNELVAVRQEDPAVFTATHVRILEWVGRGLVDGLRIDHVDGLLDPRGYLEMLRDAVAAARPAPPTPLYVEKILGHDEELPRCWPVAGTTGYEFLGGAVAVFTHPAGFAEIEAWYRRRVLRRPDVRGFHDVVVAGKRAILAGALRPDVARVVALAAAALDQAPAASRDELTAAVSELIVWLPVYRTYVDGRGPMTAADRRAVAVALAGARGGGRAPHAALDALAGLLDAFAATPAPSAPALRFVQRWQQASGPATAKGVEDTALYAYVPLVSRNVVGSGPDQPLAGAVEAFHAASRARAARWPRSLLCISTHDTKRSADVRARLNVLSELPALWRARVEEWRRWNRTLRRPFGGRRVPDANTEYLLYQTMVGIWPLVPPAPHRPGEPGDLPAQAELDAVRGRLEAYMLKAAREAKVHTSWVDPDPVFEEALTGFVQALLPADAHVHPSPFIRDLHALTSRVARPGLWNALARTLLQLTAPGVPDVYQGDELWNFVLVDPDNRRPIDWERRRAVLDELEAALAAGGPAARARLAEALLATPEDGRVKLYLIWTALQARRAAPALFASGDYTPLVPEGAAAGHVLAFLRQAGDACALVAVPRLATALGADPATPPTVAGIWGDTRLRLPADLAGRELVSLLDGGVVRLARTDAPPFLECGALFARFPGALLLDRKSTSGSGIG